MLLRSTRAGSIGDRGAGLLELFDERSGLRHGDLYGCTRVDHGRHALEHHAIGAVQLRARVCDEHSGTHQRARERRQRLRGGVRLCGVGTSVWWPIHDGIRPISRNHFGRASSAYAAFARNRSPYTGTKTAGTPNRRKAMQRTP